MARKKLADAIEDLTGAFKKVAVAAKSSAKAMKIAAAAMNGSTSGMHAMGSKPATFREWRARPGLFGDKVSRAMQNPGKAPAPSQKGSCRRRRAAKAR